MTAEFVTPRQRRRQMAKAAERLERMGAREDRIIAAVEARQAEDALCLCRSKGKPKKKYETDEQATKVLRTMKGYYGGTYRVYKCPTAARYHITTRKK